MRCASSTASRVSVSEPTLVHLHEQRVRSTQLNALLQAGGVGNEQVVADQLDAATDLGGQGLPSIPLVLIQRILDGNQRVVRDELLVVLNHVLGRAAFTLELVQAVLEELGGGDVQGQGNVFARLEASLLDRGDDQVEGLSVGVQVGGEAALVAQTGGQAAVLHDALERVVDLGAQRRASRKEGAPRGAIMNSWMSTLESAWEPPLRMFIMGTGRT